MQASDAIENALADRRTIGERGAVEIRFEWPGKPGWRLLRRVTAVRSILGDIFEAPFEIIGSGPGCFYVVFSVKIDPDEFEMGWKKTYRNKLILLRERFGVSKISVSSSRLKSGLVG